MVHLLAGDGSGDARVGFVVSRSVGTAVVRNRVKRRLREIVRGRVRDLPAGSLVVVRAHPSAATLASGQLRQDLERALDRALAGAVGARGGATGRAESSSATAVAGSAAASVPAGPSSPASVEGGC